MHREREDTRVDTRRIVVTGAAGFIGSCLVGGLNDAGHSQLVLVDDFTRDDKWPNLDGKRYEELIERSLFPEWLKRHASSVDFVFHFGARTDTTEFDVNVFDRLNLNYSKKVWSACAGAGIPLVYASSAATYGLGEHGYDDDHALVPLLRPLNPYGRSKNDFDRWVLEQRQAPPFWAGLKFFNVYGPNEYHKGRMASVVYHAYRQIMETGRMRLFRSHRDGYADGEQRRDFIYVKDVVEVSLWLMETQGSAGIFNLGTGEARTFLELVHAVFDAVGQQREVEFIDTPADIRETYQYYTCARMEKLRAAGYPGKFTDLAEGISEYVRDYLQGDLYC